MHSVALLEGIDASIRWVLWVVLAVFIVLATLSWLVASRDWLNEGQESRPENQEGHAGQDETAPP